MDFKSMLIGGLGTALLFVSVGAGTTQDAPTTIQMSDNPFPYQFEKHVKFGSAIEQAFVLNRETGELFSAHSKDSGQGKHAHWLLRPVEIGAVQK